MHALLLSLVGAATLAASLDKEPILRVIKAHAGQLVRCYERELKDHPASGTMVVRFHVTETGTVDEAAVQSSTLDSPRLETCVLDAVRTWRFPTRIKGGFTVFYPFTFKPG